MLPVISFVGRSKVGKTTFLEKVVAGLKQRGYRLAVIKHDVHGFDIDQPGKDSWRFLQAGGDIVVLSSPDKMAMVRRPEQELTLQQLTALVMDGVDIIITEGYKGEDRPKIEVFRSDVSDKILSPKDELIALVSDKPFDIDVPQFGFEDVDGVVQLIEGKFLNRPAAEDIYLSVNGRDVQLKSFVKDAFIKTIAGMVSSLHGTQEARQIKLTIRLP
jgi:molybdopterin-guanine dinucleotide biosynthesis protein B